MTNFNKVRDVSSIRNVSGDFLEVANLISVLPKDYMVHIKSGKDIIWEGISWVFVFDGVGRRFKNYAVLNFEINYNNTDVMISAAWQYR